MRLLIKITFILFWTKTICASINIIQIDFMLMALYFLTVRKILISQYYFIISFSYKLINAKIKENNLHILNPSNKKTQLQQFAHCRGYEKKATI